MTGPAHIRGLSLPGLGCPVSKTCRGTRPVHSPSEWQPVCSPHVPHLPLSVS